MQELQAVMFDIGIGTPVTKEAAGKEYYTQLARQLSEFVKVERRRTHFIGSAGQMWRNNDFTGRTLLVQQSQRNRSDLARRYFHCRFDVHQAGNQDRVQETRVGCLDLRVRLDCGKICREFQPKVPDWQDSRSDKEKRSAICRTGSQQVRRKSAHHQRKFVRIVQSFNSIESRKGRCIMSRRFNRGAAVLRESIHTL